MLQQAIDQATATNSHFVGRNGKTAPCDGKRFPFLGNSTGTRRVVFIKENRDE
jgi:hypothetical protein